ncbi:hypothetical protein N7466_003340 [Penicillium verhagenii]|uniref:uncharacterized protein n=1 Tax=Penicillium verhagenii TaxID=1562060 RepID=UPI002545776D|nr:uncharacterized protein N7466_003340 [Penicillium verhagenii]KAJ5936890.1 hypothetical protein N7466_003340 [Penicillium verhagenii]
MTSEEDDRYHLLALEGSPQPDLDFTPSLFTPSLNDPRTTIPHPSEPRSSCEDEPKGYHLMNCPTRESVYKRRFSCTFITFLIVSIYATVLSGIFLVIACVRPFYHFINNNAISPHDASTFSTFLSKTIELAYVTAGVALLGQILTRKAITRASPGISLSDINMRSWMAQPGSLILHWKTARHSAWSVLGVFTLAMTLVATLYTTAAEALVSPKLSLTPVNSKLMNGDYSVMFASPQWLQDNCTAPLRNTTSCFALELAGQAYHDLDQYLQGWTALGNQTGTTLTSRPKPNTSLYDNTTITGSWIEVQNMTELSQKYGRMVNNVTAAFPHGGLFRAARDPRNNIAQPEDFSGEGKYTLDASVAAPAVNVLCVGMTKEELSPLVYSAWNTSKPFDATTWYDQDVATMTLFNHTVVDDLFGFEDINIRFGSQDYDTQGAPIFPEYPDAWNTIIDQKVNNSYAIYILGANDPDYNPPYTLCSMQAKLSGRCSAQYEVVSSGGQMTVNCENSSNKLQYDRLNPNTDEGQYDYNWRELAATWAAAVNLGSGINDDDASIEQLLLTMIPSFDNTTNYTALDPALPSISEALAVLAAGTLILGSQYSPFVQYWNDSKHNNYTTPHPATFPATLQSMAYASGRVTGWTQMFYVILALAFLTSFICMGFMLLELRGKLVTDFTELPNLFALAMSSPSSEQLRGACGGGPSDEQFAERWHVGLVEDTEHYYIRSKGEENIASPFQELASHDMVRRGTARSAINDFRRLSSGAVSKISWL